MPVLRAILGLVLLPVVLAACSGGSSPGGAAVTAQPRSDPSSASPPPTPLATGTASPTIGSTSPAASGTPQATAAGPARCHTSELHGAFHDFPGGAAGNDRFDVLLTNTSVRSCTLDGYPGLGFLGTQGQSEQVTVKRGSGMLSHNPGPHPILLRPRQTASASVSYTPNCNRPDASDGAVPHSVEITPPDERDHVTATVRTDRRRLQICGGAVTVTALVPGSDGVLGRVSELMR